MGKKLHWSRQAVVQLLKTAGPQDEFFLVQSSNRPVLITAFTTDTDEIDSRLALAQPVGRSALLDAIYMALGQLKGARNPHKALLVISDGGNNSSRYSEGEIKLIVREADIPIYAIGVYEPFALRGRTAEELFGPGLLYGLADQSGARHFAVEALAEVPDVIAQLSKALRAERR